MVFSRMAYMLQLYAQHKEADMPISLDSVLGVHVQALQLRSKRSEVLASNLANADTPNYKARDINFSSTLSNEAESSAGLLKSTNKNHIKDAMAPTGSPVMLYRIPNQSSLDGNTVDTQVEQAEFAKNAVQYEATVTLLQHKLRGLRSAIRGD